MSDYRPQAPEAVVAGDRLRGLTKLLRSSGEEIESVVVGDSMGESLRAGTPIRIFCDDAAPLPDGCVIAFAAGEHLVAHRVVARGRLRPGARTFLLTRGDGRVICDPPVHRSLVLGRVTAYRHDAEWHQSIPAPPPPGFVSRLTTGAVALALEANLGLARVVHAAFYLAGRAARRLGSSPRRS